MSLFRRLNFIGLAVVVLQACKLSQPEPSIAGQRDSLINVVIPDFATIIKASVTPKGKLDHMTTTYQAGNPGSETGVTTTFLYDANQRISGYTNLDSPSKGVDNAYIYEYESDKLVRIFYKAINPNQPMFYFMEQWVYSTNNQPTAHRLYRVELDGKARLLSRDRFIYDSANRLVEINDANGYHMGQLFEYAGNKLQTVRHKHANGTLSEVRTDYRYDDKPSILKGVFLRFSPEYIDHSLSTNNLISKTYRDNQTLSTSYDYTTQYDSQDRLIRRQLTAPGLGLTTESYFFNE